MSSIKREIRHFHVIVVQKRAKECTKKRDARANLLFCFWNLLFFWRSRCRLRRWILKSLFWRENVIAVIILLRVLPRMS